ncbi:MAG TPA: response regulator [Dehalococcoidia bacterium]|nr:response regulator [Dehalococcoidia bacterium]
MSRTRMNKQRILLVEDEPVIARVCARILAADGLCVDIARDGSAARTMVNRARYDMCLSDIMMPGVSGIDFYEYLVEEQPMLAERVVFMTGDTLSPKTEKFLSEASRPYLPKPFTPAELRRMVFKILRQETVSV